MSNKSSRWSVSQKNTLNFIKEYLLEQEIRDEYPVNEDIEIDNTDDFPVVEEETPVSLSPPRPWDGDVIPGDIRLLSEMNCFQYVLVLEKRDWNYLIVPFSSYSFPATDCELLLQAKGGAGLEVVQIWNARTIHYLQLKKSYRVGDALPEDMKAIYAVRSHFLQRTPLPENLINQTGVPIYQDDDPRIEYQEKFLALFSEVDRKDFELLELEEQMQNALKRSDFPSRISFAAASTQSLLSEIYLCDSQTPEEITRNLASGKNFGVYAGTAELCDWNSEEKIWQLSGWQKGSSPVVFWDRFQNMLVGFGELIQQKTMSAIFLRCGSKAFSVNDFQSKNIVLLVGKNEQN